MSAGGRSESGRGVPISGGDESCMCKETEDSARSTSVLIALLAAPIDKALTRIPYSDITGGASADSRRDEAAFLAPIIHLQPVKYGRPSLPADAQKPNARHTSGRAA